MSNDSSASGDEASASTDGNKSDRSQLRRQASSARPPAAVAATHSKNSEQLTLVKKKRNLPGNPDPDSEVIALSPKTLLATNRFICEICNKGFQRDQNLQLHRRGHNLPWKLRQRTSKEIKRRVYICPETTCVHHDPARALGDLTGIKKHFCRKHWEKKWKCDKCSKRYAVQSDYKAHMKICGTREYQCHCGTSFSRRDSFITHRAFCDALVEENERVSAHRQGGTQHPGDIENTLNTGSLEGPSSNIGANSSSRGATSPLSGDRADPLTSSALLKPGASDNTWSMALSEGAIASLASMWTQGSTEASSGLIASNTGPRLSLYLGTGPGPGPGPPGARPMMQGSQMQSSSSLLTSSDSDHPFQMQPPKGMRGGMEVTGMGGSADFGATHAPKLPSELMPLPSSNGGILANIFASGGGFPDLQGPSPERSLGVSHSGVAGLAGLMNQGTSAAGLQLSSAGMFTGRNSATGIGGGRISSISQHQSSRAQMSATALLQKAAQMGVTGSSPSLLRGCGLEGGDLGYSTFGGTLQDSQQNQGRLVLNSLLSGSFPPYLTMMRRLEGIQQQTQGLEHPDGPSFSLQGRSNENIGAQDFVNSLSGRTDLFGGGLNHPPCLFGPSGNHSGAETPSIDLLNHCESRNSGQNSLLNMLQGFSQSQAAGSHMGQSQRSEDGGDRPTLDFLGVQGRNRMGVAGDVGCILSHRDLASITLLGTGAETASSNNQRKKIRMVGGGHSPGKS